MYGLLLVIYSKELHYIYVQDQEPQKIILHLTDNLY